MSMTRQGFRLDLVDPAIFTASTATAEQGESLEYVPGAALWGALARRLYEKAGDSWAMFHSGALRITDGLPLFAKGIGWPVPMSLHRPKYPSDEAAEQTRMCLASGEAPADRQMVQLRDACVVAGDGALLHPQMEAAIKTAIDPRTGGAAEAQLFALEALQAGQSFVFWLEGEAALVQAAGDALAGTLHLGRSRSAEFGTVQLTPVAMPQPVAGSSRHMNRAFLWALSDWCLSDGTGQPSLAPDPETLGISAASVVWSRSFLRFRRTWPYNAKWQARGLERQLIARGSVVCLEDVTAAPGLIWVGEQNAAGYGLGLLSEAAPHESLANLPGYAEGNAENRGGENGKAEPSSLIAWLRGRHDAASAQRAAYDRSHTISEELGGVLASARRHPSNVVAPPGKTQWNAVRTLLLDWVRDPASAVAGPTDAMFGSDGPVRDSDDLWKVVAADPQDTTRLISVRDWLEGQVSAAGTDTAQIQALAKAVELTVKRMDDEGAR